MINDDFRVNKLICPKCKGGLQIDFSMPVMDTNPPIYAVECYNCRSTGSYSEDFKEWVKEA